MFTEHLVRRLAAVMLLLMLAPVTYASAVCGGWAGSAAERMACCQRGSEHCPSVSADDCCAGQEQRRTLETAPAVLITPDATVSESLPVALRVPRSFVFDPRSLAERPDTYLLDTAFLI